MPGCYLIFKCSIQYSFHGNGCNYEFALMDIFEDLVLHRPYTIHTPELKEAAKGSEMDEKRDIDIFQI